MKAIKINAETRQVEALEIDGLEGLQKAVGGYITVATGLDDEGEVSARETHTMYVDDEGLFKYQYGFFYDGSHQPFAGNGVIVGFDAKTGVDRNAIVSLEEVESKVAWF